MKKFASFIKKHPLSIIFFVLTIFLMGLIFSFSGQVAEVSSAVSDGVCRFLAELFVSGFDDLNAAEKEMQIQALVPIIRKGAHFCIYAALGFCSAGSLFSFRAESGREFKARFALFPALFCLIYAVSDEFHQLFVSGRSGQIRDVLIDFSGTVLGISAFLLVFLFFMFIRQKRAQKTKKYQM